MSTPYYGNKINLISKSEIRYEGYLWAIDAKESTIALAQVRSFGTEDRPVNQPVAAREEIFEYIIFRAKDIKDIIVGDFPPNASEELGDPAILHAQQTVQNVTSSIPTKPEVTNVNLTSNGAIGTTKGASSSPVGTRANEILNMAMFSNVNLCSQGNATSGPPSTGPAFTLASDYRSGRSTPNSVQRRSPTSEEVARLPSEGQSHKEEKSNQSNQQQGNRDNRSQNNQQNYRGGFGNDRRVAPQFKRRPMLHQNPQAVRPMPQMNYRGPRSGPMPNGPQKRGPMINRAPPQPRVMNPNRGPINRNLRHDASKMKDYDFEKANKEFEELEIKFSKAKVDDTEKKDDEKEPETDVKEGDKNDEENVFYDKTKSFFDKISCESIERSKGKVNRTDWKRERKINEETFGLTANYRRGGYRGRGGFTGSYSGFSRQNYSNRNYNQRNAINGPKNSVPPSNERRNLQVESW